MDLLFEVSCGRARFDIEEDRFGVIGGSEGGKFGERGEERREIGGGLSHLLD